MGIKVSLYYNAESAMAAHPQTAVIENKKIRLWKGDGFAFSWHDFTYEIVHRNAANKEFNLKIITNISGVEIAYHTYLNPWKMFLFKRMYSSHGSKAENMRFIWGLVIGFLAGYLLWLLTHTCH